MTNTETDPGHFAGWGGIGWSGKGIDSKDLCVRSFDILGIYSNFTRKNKIF